MHVAAEADVFFFLVVETELAICLSAGAWRTGCTGTGAGGPSSAASLKRPPQGTGWLLASWLLVGWGVERAAQRPSNLDWPPHARSCRGGVALRRSRPARHASLAPPIQPTSCCRRRATRVLRSIWSPSLASHSITKIGPWPCNHTNRSPAREAHIQRLHSATKVQRWCVPKRWKDAFIVGRIFFLFTVVHRKNLTTNQTKISQPQIWDHSNFQAWSWTKIWFNFLRYANKEHSFT
jgi:hypothetical protein